MTREYGPINYKEFSKIPEVEEGLVEAWFPKKELCYPTEPLEHHQLPWDTLKRPIDLTPYELEQVEHPEIEITPAESNSWLSALKNKWKKKSQ